MAQQPSPANEQGITPPQIPDGAGSTDNAQWLDIATSTSHTALQIGLWVMAVLCIVAAIAAETLGPVILNRTTSDRRFIHGIAVIFTVMAGLLFYGALTV